MKINVHVSFAGCCAEAFARYREILGGELVASLTYAETPAAAGMSAEWQGKVIHACLDLGSTMLMGCDAPPDRFQRAAGFSVQVAPETVAEGERVFAALAEGGTVQMPFGPTFWSAGFGMAIDRFGLPWMVNCNQPPAEVKG